MDIEFDGEHPDAEREAIERDFPGDVVRAAVARGEEARAAGRYIEVNDEFWAAFRSRVRLRAKAVAAPDR